MIKILNITMVFHCCGVVYFDWVNSFKGKILKRKSNDHFLWTFPNNKLFLSFSNKNKRNSTCIHHLNWIPCRLMNLLDCISHLHVLNCTNNKKYITCTWCNIIDKMKDFSLLGCASWGWKEECNYGIKDIRG